MVLRGIFSWKPSNSHLKIKKKDQNMFILINIGNNSIACDIKRYHFEHIHIIQLISIRKSILLDSLKKI